MERIVWNESFIVGNSEIDEQHKKWFSIYNNLHDALNTKNKDEIHNKTLIHTLQSMQEYTRHHFSFEEEYMKKINYPDRANHWRKHKEFDQLIYEYIKNLQEGKVVLICDIFQILTDKIQNHIFVEDKKYSLFIKNEI